MLFSDNKPNSPLILIDFGLSVMLEHKDTQTLRRSVGTVTFIFLLIISSLAFIYSPRSNKEKL